MKLLFVILALPALATPSVAADMPLHKSPAPVVIAAPPAAEQPTATAYLWTLARPRCSWIWSYDPFDYFNDRFERAPREYLSPDVVAPPPCAGKQ
jgi:hypothetical protein